MDSTEKFREYLEVVASRMNERGHHLEGACQFELATDSGERVIHVRLDDQGAVRVFEGRHEAPIASMRMHPETARAIAIPGTGGAFDFRKPEHAARIQISGDRGQVLGVVSEYRVDTRPIAAMWAEASRVAAANGPITQIKRISAADVDAVHAAIKQSTPCVLTWEHAPRSAMWSWSVDGLTRDYGQLPGALNALYDARETTLAQCLQQLKDGLFQGSGGFAVPREMYPDLARVPGFADERWFRPLLWLGVQGARTPLHRDPFHNFNSQVLGRKQWRLAAPGDAENVYAKVPFPSYQGAHADPIQPDYVRHPLFKNVHITEVIVNPGETVMVPSGWFHDVYLLDSVNLSVGMGVKDERFAPETPK